MSRSRSWLCAAWTGALLGVCQMEPYALAWFALLPLVLAVVGASPLRAAGLGFLSGVVAGLALYGVLPYGWSLYVMLVVYCGLHMAVFGWFVAFSQRRWPERVRWLLPAVAWTALEYTRRLGTLSFPITLAGTQTDWPILLQVAAITGTHGVSFLVAMPSGLLAEGWRQRRISGLSASVAVGIFSVALGFGALRLVSDDASPGGLEPLQVAGVQTALPNWVYRVAEVSAPHQSLVKEKTVAATRRALAKGAKLVIWPETVIHEPVLHTPQLWQPLQALADRHQASVIVGSVREGEGGDLYNSAIVFSAGRAPQIQDKRRPAGYAEWHVKAGQRFRLIDSGYGRYGVLICLESVYPQDSRALVRAGAQWLVVTTDDAGFRRSPLPFFHARRSALRAVETDRWVVHLSQAGPSFVFDPRGRVAARLSLFEEGLLEGEIFRRSGRTPYVIAGDVFSWACWLSLLLGGLPRRRAKSSSVT